MTPHPTAGRTRVLVVEDDPGYCEGLVTALGHEGFEVAVATTCSDGLRQFTESQPDIVLLDVLLPDGSGIDLCRRMGELANVPIMLVSALSDELEVVLGLELGAADYVTKPYRLRELIARMRAVLRRTGGQEDLSPGTSTLPDDGDRFATVGPIEVHFMARKLYVGGRLVHLARREFDLLALLASPPGIVRTREELIDRIWWDVKLESTRTLDRHIAVLRAKIEPEPGNPQYLITMYGVGYRLRDPSDGGSGVAL